MGKLFKFLAGLIVFVVLLVALGGVLLHFYFDPNDYKDKIIEQVKEKTGRDLIISERINLSVFPWLALELGGVELKNNAYFNDKTSFAKVKKLNVRVKIKPLFSKKLEIDTVILQGLVLNLEKNEKGITNWQDFTSDQAKAPKKSAPESNKSSDFKLNSFTVDGIQIENAHVSWLDKQTSQDYQLDAFNLNIGSLQPDQATDVALNGHIKGKKLNIDSQFDIKSRLTFSKNMQHFVLDNMALSVQAAGDILPAKKMNINLESSIDVDLSKQFALLKNLALNLKTSGARTIPFNLFVMDLNTTEIRYEMNNGQLQIAPFSLNLSGQDKTAAVPFNQINLQTKGNAVSYTVSNGMAKINALQATLKAAQGTKDLNQVNLNIKTDLAWNGKSQQLNLPQLILTGAVNGEAIPMKKLTVNLKSGINVHLTPMKINLQKMALIVNKSHINGNFMIMPSAGPTVHFNLAIDAIDLNDYIAADKTETAPAASKTAKKAPVNKDPLAALRPLNIDGQLKLGKLTMQDINATDVYFTVKGKNGDIKIKRIGTKIYGGKLDGSARLDARYKTPKIYINQKLKGIEIGMLLKQLADKDSLEGKGDLNLNLSMRGLDPVLIKKTLNGKVNFIFYDGAVKGMNLAANARQLQSFLSGKKGGNEPQKTDFSELSGSASIKNGLVKNNDLKLMSQLIRVHGKGEVNLPKQTINYLLQAKVVKSLKGQGGMTFKQLPGVPVAIRLKGDLQNPKKEIRLGQAIKQLAGIDLDAKKKALKEKLQKRLKEKLGKELGEDLNNQLQENLGGALKGLFR